MTKPALYPNAIQYKDSHSSLGNGLSDLIMSFDHKVIASNLINLTIGNTAIVAYNDVKEGVLYAFGAIIIERLDYQPTIWKTNGGQMWAGNWSIEPITRIERLTWDQIENLIGQPPTRHIINQSMGGGGKNIPKIGKPRQMIIEHMRKI